MNAFYRLIAAAALSVAVLAAGPAAAVAAPNTDMWEAGMATMADLDLKKQPTYSITVQLKKDFKLPAKVTIPFPKGCQPLWVGEVFFGDAKNDIPADDAKMVTEGDTNYLTFTMRKSRAARVECSVAPDMVSGVMAERSINMYWKLPSMDSTAQAAVFTPEGFAAKENPKGVTVLRAKEGGLYVVTDETPKKGQTLRVEFVLVQGDLVPQDADPKPDAGKTATSTASQATTSAAATAPAAVTTAPAQPALPAPAQGSDTTLTVILVLAGVGLVAAVVALVMVVRRERSS